MSKAARRAFRYRLAQSKKIEERVRSESEGTPRKFRRHAELLEKPEPVQSRFLASLMKVFDREKEHE